MEKLDRKSCCECRVEKVRKFVLFGTINVLKRVFTRVLFVAELCVVRHAFEATEASHLQLRMGRIVEVVDKSGNGWWRGMVDDEVGWFPATYVKPIDGMCVISVREFF